MIWAITLFLILATVSVLFLWLSRGGRFDGASGISESLVALGASLTTVGMMAAVFWMLMDFSSRFPPHDAVVVLVIVLGALLGVSPMLIHFYMYDRREKARMRIFFDTSEGQHFLQVRDGILSGADKDNKALANDLRAKGMTFKG